MKKVTVLFSTYNGEKTLRYFLDSLFRQTMDKDLWKVVAVNNNSTDQTQAILEEYLEALPLHILFEERQGKSYAIDQGFQHIEGDLLILTDDDVIADPDWLEVMVKTAEEKKDYDLFSGLIKPNWEEAPPQWIREWAQMGVLYSLNDHFPEGEILPELLMGPNSMFRTSILPDKYIVDEYLGPNQSETFAMGEDTVFAYHLAKEKNLKAWHTHQTAVSHFIPVQSFDETWMWKRAIRHGLGVPVIFPQHYGSKLKIMGRPIRTLLKYIVMGVCVPIVKLLPKSQKRFHFLWQYYRLHGILSHDLRNIKTS